MISVARVPPRLFGLLVAGVLTGLLMWLGVSLRPPPAARWTVTQRTTAHGMLVLEVETRYPDEALSIARTLVEPEHGRFTEVLVFFHPIGRRDTLRRVRWTRQQGYDEWVYGAR